MDGVDDADVDPREPQPYRLHQQPSRVLECGAQRDLARKEAAGAAQHQDERDGHRHGHQQENGHPNALATDFPFVHETFPGPLS